MEHHASAPASTPPSPTQAPQVNNPIVLNADIEQTDWSGIVYEQVDGDPELGGQIKEAIRNIKDSMGESELQWKDASGLDVKIYEAFGVVPEAESELAQQENQQHRGRLRSGQPASGQPLVGNPPTGQPATGQPSTTHPSTIPPPVRQYPVENPPRADPPRAFVQQPSLQPMAQQPHHQFTQSPQNYSYQDGIYPRSLPPFQSVQYPQNNLGPHTMPNSQITQQACLPGYGSPHGPGDFSSGTTPIPYPGAQAQTGYSSQYQHVGQPYPTAPYNQMAQCPPAYGQPAQNYQFHEGSAHLLGNSLQQSGGITYPPQQGHSHRDRVARTQRRVVGAVQLSEQRDGAHHNNHVQQGNYVPQGNGGQQGNYGQPGSQGQQGYHTQHSSHVQQGNHGQQGDSGQQGDQGQQGNDGQ